MAVLAPTPKATVSAAVSAKTGLFRKVRPARPNRGMASFHLIHQLWSRRGYYLCYPFAAPSFFGTVLCRRSCLLRLASLARWHYSATRSARSLSVLLLS